MLSDRIFLSSFIQSMTSIPRPPEEEKKSEEAEGNVDEEETENKDTATDNDMEKEQGSPIVNEVEEMEAEAN